MADSDLPRRMITAGYMARGIWKTVFAERCPLCRQTLAWNKGGCLCAECIASIEVMADPVCQICGRPMSPVSMPGSGVCGFCEVEPPRLNKARSYGIYDGALAVAIKAFKFNERRVLARALQGLILDADSQWLGQVEVDAVVPVPLHKNRLRQRGFNQAHDLARPLARKRGVELLAGALVRVRDTEPQYGLSVSQRRINVRGAFQADAAFPLAGKKVLLVDDIMTTGITLNECAKALQKAKAAEVIALTLARVRQGGQRKEGESHD